MICDTSCIFHLFPPGSALCLSRISKDQQANSAIPKWLFYLNAGVGPMQGQANHFTRYAPEHIEYGVNRYQNETRRLYRVLDDHLKTSTSGYLVGDRCTIAGKSKFRNQYLRTVCLLLIWSLCWLRYRTLGMDHRCILGRCQHR